MVEKYQSNLETELSSEKEASGAWSDWSAREYAWKKENGLFYRGSRKETEDIILIKELLNSAVDSDDLIRWGHYDTVLRSGTSSERGWGDSGGYADTGPQTKDREGWLLQAGKNFCVLDNNKNTPINYIYQKAFENFIKPRIDYLESFMEKVNEMTAEKQDINAKASDKSGDEHPFKQEWLLEKQKIKNLVVTVQEKFSDYLSKDYNYKKEIEKSSKKMDVLKERASDLLSREDETRQHIGENNFYAKLRTFGEKREKLMFFLENWSSRFSENSKLRDEYQLDDIYPIDAQLEKIRSILNKINSEIENSEKLLSENPNDLLSMHEKTKLRNLEDEINKQESILKQIKAVAEPTILKIEKAVENREAEIKVFFKEHFGVCKLCSQRMQETKDPNELYCGNTEGHPRGDSITWLRSGSGKNKGQAYLITIPTGEPGKGSMQRKYGAEQYIVPKLPDDNYSESDIEKKTTKTVVYSRLVDEPEYFKLQAEVNYWDNTVLSNTKTADGSKDEENENKKEENGNDSGMGDLFGKLKNKWGGKK